jgi:hypothetical protein
VSDLKYYYFSLWISILSVLIIFGALYLCRRKLMAGFGFIGLLALVVFECSLLLLPLIWILSLWPNRDRLNDPEMFGIGGGVFGIQYENYPLALGMLVSIGLGGLIGLVLVSASKLPALPREIGDFGQLKYRWADIVRKWGVDRYICIASFFIFTLYFTANGWGRLWDSELGRFDEVYTRFFYFFADLKIFLPLLLLCGTSAATSLAVARSPWWSLFAILFSVCPFIVQASRGFSVLVPCLALALCYRWKIPKLLVLPIMAVVFVYASYMPLSLRGQADTGLLVFIKEHVVWNDAGGDLTQKLSTVGQNLSQGFPILVDTITKERADGDLLKSIPTMYWVLSFSPTISLVDGFGTNYVQYTPFVNFFTPLSAYAELYVISPILFILLPILWVWTYLFLIRRLLFLGPWGAILSIGVLVLFFSALLQAHQYPIRTTMRFVFLGFAVGGFGLMFVSARMPVVGNSGRVGRTQSMRRGH